MACPSQKCPGIISCHLERDLTGRLSDKLLGEKGVQGLPLTLLPSAFITQPPLSLSYGLELIAWAYLETGKTNQDDDIACSGEHISCK